MVRKLYETNLESKQFERVSFFQTQTCDQNVSPQLFTRSMIYTEKFKRLC